MHHRQYGSIQEQERIAQMDPMRLPCYKANRVIVKVSPTLPMPSSTSPIRSRPINSPPGRRAGRNFRSDPL